jgi:two-component sensor histidine kinase
MNTILNYERPANLAARETHHRIANSLAAISALVRMKATDPYLEASVEHVREVLLDVSGRIDLLARLHRLLAHANSKAVPLAQFLRDVCEAMGSIVLDDGQVKATVECSGDLTLRPEASVPLGLLAAELFSNSVKYAHPTGLPTIIRIGCAQAQDGMLTFMFEDDGVGLPENFDPAHDGGLGMRLVQGLSDQLHGQFEWRDIGVGLRFICRLPT